MISGLSSRRRPILRAALAACVASAALTGCAYDGGLPYSADQFTYNSTPWRPYTVSLVDTRTGETVWLVDIPVEHTLQCSFRSGSGPNSYKPDMMSWKVFPTDRSASTSRSTLPVPDTTARRLDVVIRPVPEFPDSTPGRSPFTQPSQVFSQSDVGGEAESQAVGNQDTAETLSRPVPYVPVEAPATNTPVTIEEPPVEEPPAVEPQADEPPIDIPD